MSNRGATAAYLHANQISENAVSTGIDASIPDEDTWWEISICFVSQLGNVFRIGYFLLSFHDLTSLQEWILLLVCAIGSWICADFLGGLYHWFADSYRSQNRTVNAIFFDNFQLHHEKPSLICQRPLANVNWEVNLPSFFLTLYSICLPDGMFYFSTRRSFIFLSMLAGWISVTNQAHRWAHQAQVPRIAKILQMTGIILSPREHRTHHSREHLRSYCITSGVCNSTLNAICFWRHLEWLVFTLFGVQSYSMLLKDPHALSQSPFAFQKTASVSMVSNGQWKRTKTDDEHEKEDASALRAKRKAAQKHNASTSYLYDFVLSPAYERLAAFLWPSYVHPNFITLFGGIMCGGAILAFHLEHRKLACVLFTLYHMMDNMDGKHARRTGQTSDFGGFLDHTVDGTVGVYMGYQSVVKIVFGLQPGTPLFNLGRHCFFLLWLCPHVVHQLEPKKGLILGTKLCSVDEGFIAVSLLLYYHAWISTEPIIAKQEAATEVASYLVGALALGFVTTKTFYVTMSGKLWWWMMAYWSFACGAVAFKNSWLWWLLWTPFMMVSVAKYT